MRIQLLGINYAPERTGVAPYTTGLARHLSREHQVTVLTGLPHYPDWHVEPEHRHWRAEERDHDLRVVRLSHFVPRTPNVASRALYELTWAARAAAAGRAVPTDLVIAVVPALLGAQAARSIAAHHKTPFGIFVQDIMGTAAQQSGAKGGRAVSRFTAPIERSALHRADGVATIHQKMAAHLAALGAASPDVIYNWTHVTTRPRPGSMMRDKLGWKPDEIIALHSGNMGAKQNLEVIVDAARLAESDGRPVRFVLAGGGSQRAALERYATGCTRVTFLPSVDDDDYMDLLASADVLLVNERPGMAEMSMPSKLTSYLVAGRPIVAATDAHSATAEFVNTCGGGVVTTAGDHGLLLDTVVKVAGDSGWSAQLVNDGQAFAHEHLTEAAAMSAYDEWIAQLVGGRARR